MSRWTPEQQRRYTLATGWWFVLSGASFATDRYCEECEELGGEHKGNCLSEDNAEDYEPSDADLRAYYDCDYEPSDRHQSEWDDKHGRGSL